MISFELAIHQYLDLFCKREIHDKLLVLWLLCSLPSFKLTQRHLSRTSLLRAIRRWKNKTKLQGMVHLARLLLINTTDALTCESVYRYVCSFEYTYRLFLTSFSCRNDTAELRMNS